MQKEERSKIILYFSLILALSALSTGYRSFAGLQGRAGGSASVRQEANIGEPSGFHWPERWVEHGLGRYKRKQRQRW